MSRLKDLFNAAIELEPRERAAFLDRECTSDPDLRRRLDILLRAHDDPDSNVVGPLAAGRTGTFALDDHATGTFGNSNVTSDHEPQADVGTVIAGKYKLIEMIGEGGMGSVWMAQQTEPVKRAVAIKLIKAGMDSKAVLARFDAERQALAVMDHPNIARVLDGGATPDGRPFFVMELVKGVPITQFCDERKLTPHQRLELFIPVCQAIQHAHQKGVIHRDIKPNNVLVALYDDKPVPKVIDFGVAKATGATLTDHTLMTGFDAVVGTPEYMSPEQASLNNLDIDTRSDVYSLGVLLYELLTGTTPVGRKSLGKAVILEVLRIVREVEAPRPSAKLSSSGTLPSVAANRSMDPAKLSWLLKRDLDWIVLKSLEKDRARRYESANGLAADVQRYLAGEAVQAHPPSRGYRLRKFAQKNRAVLSTAAAFVLLMVGAVAVSGWLAVQARRASEFAELKRIEAEASATDASVRGKQLAYYFGFLESELEITTEDRYNAELSAAGLQVDLDIAEHHNDPRTALLRLAERLKAWKAIAPTRLVKYQSLGTESVIRVPEELLKRDRELREFVTAAVLSFGQNFAPLLPPIAHDGQAVLSQSLSPDSKILLTLGKDGSARLWDVRTAKPIAILCQGNEQVANCGFSPEGKTAFTYDYSGIARFWDVPSGKFRAEMQRPKDYVLGLVDPHGEVKLEMNENRLLTSIGRDIGPVELWDTSTGQLVARFTRNARLGGLAKSLGFEDRGDFMSNSSESLGFNLRGQLISRIEDENTVSVFSAHDGKLVGQLNHPSTELLLSLAVSFTGKKIATTSVKISHDKLQEKAGFVRIWDATSLRSKPLLIPIEARENFLNSECVFLTEDVFEVLESRGLAGSSKLGVYCYDWSDPIISTSQSDDFQFLSTSIDNMAITPVGRIFDLRNKRKVRPPVGHKFHPDLVKFAPDGRFVLGFEFAKADKLILAPRVENMLIDTRTEKTFSIDGASYMPEVGWVGFGDRSGSEIHLIPSAQLDLPSEILQLWAQVAVRGELGPEGEFIKWNEQTWDLKREELARAPVANSNIPFPGYVATDKLHWLRAEFTEAKTDATKLRLATELLRRSELTGDRIEAVRWREQIGSLTANIAPLPREVKP